MRLASIDVANFRLLQQVSVKLDAEGSTTVFVGPNNSGKTSMAEALGLFVAGAAKAFTVSDFSMNNHADFQAFEMACRELAKVRAAKTAEATGALAQPASVEAAPAEAIQAAPPPAEPVHVEAMQAEFPPAKMPEVQEAPKDAVLPELPLLPAMSMTLLFEYADLAEDLIVAEEVLMDLGEQSYKIAVQVEFAANDPVRLADDYLERIAKEPVSLLEFLGERLADYYTVSVYKVRPGTTERELLPDKAVLERLVRIDFLPAQRHMEDQEGAQATRLSRLLNTHYERRYKLDQPESYDELERAVRAQSSDLTGKYAAAFKDLKDTLVQFGYPHTPDLTIKAELTASTLFKDNTRVYYAARTGAAEGARPVTYDLPERSNGLGFKNLIYMVLQLKAFRDELESGEGARPRVHLIIVEEPEVHLHPQMQSVFIDKAGKFLHVGGRDAQLILTTHSSHIVAGCGFSPIRYFRSKGPRAAVKDLLAFRDSKTDKEARDAVDFLAQYLTLTRCDLFFCEKAVLIEGAVERLLLPKMIAQAAALGQSNLTSTYLSIVEVGGAYAHTFKDLVKFIEVPTLIITDLDAVDQDRKKCKVAVGHSTSNATLKSWLPGKTVLKELLEATDDQKVDLATRVAYQVPDEAHLACGRSFEEAFVYRNAEWLTINRAKLLATGDWFEFPSADALREAAFDLDLPKVDFALDLIVQGGWQTPKYIADGLLWLAGQRA